MRGWNQPSTLLYRLAKFFIFNPKGLSVESYIDIFANSMGIQGQVHDEHRELFWSEKNFCYWEMQQTQQPKILWVGLL